MVHDFLITLYRYKSVEILFELFHSDVSYITLLCEGQVVNINWSWMCVALKRFCHFYKALAWTKTYLI